MTAEAKATDAPPCPSCGSALGTPINLAEVERWDGPQDATLFCPACGHGWGGTAEDVALAERGWRAYEGESVGQPRAVVDALAEDTDDNEPTTPDPRQLDLITKGTP